MEQHAKKIDLSKCSIAWRIANGYYPVPVGGEYVLTNPLGDEIPLPPYRGDDELRRTTINHGLDQADDIEITITGTKHGIGKTTVGKIIGYALQQQGIKVGMLDAPDRIPAMCPASTLTQKHFEPVNINWEPGSTKVRITIQDKTLAKKKSDKENINNLLTELTKLVETIA